MTENTAENPLIPMGAITGHPSREELTETLRTWREVGVTQFLIYARSGCELDYLSEEWFDMCRWICREARRLGFTSIWLYDEFNWPSGTCDCRIMRENPDDALPMLAVHGSRGHWDFILRHSPMMSNLFSETVVDRFIQLTHERYAENLQEFFGTLIKGFFTDEPDIACYGRMPDYGDALGIPWYEGLEQDYRQLTGGDLREDIRRALDRGEKPSMEACNRIYAEKFRNGFARRISDWCRDHGLVLTGHLMNEFNAPQALRCNGHILRVLSAFSQPGMDEIFTHRTVGLIEWLTLGTVMYALEKQGNAGGLAELFALGPCDMTLETMRRQIWLTAAFGVSRYVLAVSQLTMRGNVGKPNYFNPMTRTQPWFPAFRELGEEARLAASFAVKGRTCRIAVRYPYRPEPLTTLLKQLTMAQLSWRLAMPGEETDAEAVLDCRDGLLHEERSGRDFFDFYCWVSEFLERHGRTCAVREDGRLADEVFLREFEDGQVLVMDFSGRERRLDLQRGGGSRSIILPQNGVRILKPEDADPETPEERLAVEYAGTVLLDGATACRGEFALGRFEFEALEELDGVTLAVRGYGDVPELLLDGQAVRGTAACRSLPQGFRELYRETAPLRLARGRHVIALANQAADYPYLPAVFVLGRFFRTRDMRLGKDQRLGLFGYAGNVTQESELAIPAHAVALELETQDLCTEVSVDGVSLGRRLWHPFRWTLPEQVRNRTCRVTVRRTTSCGPLFGEHSFGDDPTSWLKRFAPHNQTAVTPIDSVRFVLDGTGKQG